MEHTQEDAAEKFRCQFQPPGLQCAVQRIWALSSMIIKNSWFTGSPFNRVYAGETSDGDVSKPVSEIKMPLNVAS
jgi:hypothetical protein